MIQRALHMEIFRMNQLFKPLLISNLSPIQFSSIVGEPIYTAHPDDTSALKINQIIYYQNTSKFRIITTPTTLNDFLIFWCVSLCTCNSLSMPTFTVLVEYEDGTLFASFPTSGTRRTDTLYNSMPLHLPTPTAAEGRVDYYISLVNQSGGDCYYSLNSYHVAGMLITCIDTP